MGWSSTSGYYSNTSWNFDLKWAILACCDQFKEEPTRLAWARTLPGRSHRAHMVLGYAEVAPLGPRDTEIISLWGILANGKMPLLNAWIQANIRNGEQLIGGISHYNAVNDRMPGVGAYSTSTLPSTMPDLRYYVSVNPGVRIDVRSSALIQPSSIPENNYMASVPMDDFMVSVDIPYEQYQQGLVESGSYEVSPKVFDTAKVLYDVFGVNDVALTENEGIMKAEEGNRSLVVETRSGNMHVLENANLLDNVGLSCTIKEGWNTAKQYLFDHNLISNQEMNEIRDVEVIKVTEQSLDVTGAQNNAPTIDIGYIYVINRYIDNIPVNISGDGLVVYVSQNGVNWVSRQWSDVNAAGEKINLIPSRNIIQGIGGILSVGNVTNDIKITGIELEYYPTATDSGIRLKPVWRCDSDNGSIIIDAETGTLISM